MYGSLSMDSHRCKLQRSNSLLVPFSTEKCPANAKRSCGALHLNVMASRDRCNSNSSGLGYLRKTSFSRYTLAFARISATQPSWLRLKSSGDSFPPMR